MDNEIERKNGVTAILFLLVQNRQQTDDWTLIRSGANRLGIQEWHYALIYHYFLYCLIVYSCHMQKYWKVVSIAIEIHPANLQCKVQCPHRPSFSSLNILPFPDLIQHEKHEKKMHALCRVYICANLFYKQRDWVFGTKSNIQTSISLELDFVNLWYFKLRLFDLTEFIVWNI